MKILFSAGGTVGTVAPLLALAEYSVAKHDNVQILFVVASSDIARRYVEQYGYRVTVITAGKWRRYAHFQNIIDIFRVGIGFLQSLAIMIRWRPSVVVSAGSFASVPVVWAAWVMHIPRCIHQQDLQKGLANTLMEPVATQITSAFAGSTTKFKNRKQIAVTGNPVRKNILEGKARSLYENTRLDSTCPLLLVLGGSSGSQFINTMVAQTISELVKTYAVLHVTGVREYQKLTPTDRYVVEPYLGENFIHALKAATVVVTRAGISTLSELAITKKACIVIPMPYTHQEENAEYFLRAGAVKVLNERDATKKTFLSMIHELMHDAEKRRVLEEHIGNMNRLDATEKMWRSIMKAYTGAPA